MFSLLNAKLINRKRQGAILRSLSHNFTKDFFIIFGGHKSFFVGPLITCFALLMMSPLVFTARVGSIICPWQRHMCYMFPKIHLKCNTCWFLGDQHGSRVILFYEPSPKIKMFFSLFLSTSQLSNSHILKIYIK